MDSVDCGKKSSAPLPPPTYPTPGGGGNYPTAIPPPLGGGGGVPPSQQPPYGQQQQQPIMGQIVPQSQHQQCTMTMELLERHLRDSNYGADRAHYLSYFLEGLPPRCLACGQPVGLHEKEPNVKVRDKKKSDEKRRKRNVNGKKDASSVFYRSTHDPHESSFEDHSTSSSGDDENEDTSNANTTTHSNGGSISGSSEQSTDNNTDDDDERDQPRCFECEEKYAELAGMMGKDIERPKFLLAEWRYKKLVSWHELGRGDGQGGGSLANPPTCDECGITPKLGCENMKGQLKEEFDEFWAKNKNLTFYRCHTCTRRTVCSKCVRRGFANPRNSRYNIGPNPQWQTSLLGCCDSPRYLCHHILCYAGQHPVGCMFPPFFNRHDLAEAISGSTSYHCSTFFMGPAWLALWFSGFLFDLSCCTIECVRAREGFMQRRFGLPPHSTAEVVFCRHCIHLRIMREAEARGYPQPVFWTSYKDIDDIVASYPPHPRRQTSPPSVEAPQPSSLV